jgi:hypothetical protein
LNVFHHEAPTFSVPCDLIEKGHLAELSPLAINLFLAILLVAQCRSAPVVTLRDELLNLVGLDLKEAAAGAVELAESGLVLPCRDGSFHLMARGRCLGPQPRKDARGNPRPALMADEGVAQEGATS